MRWLLWLCMVLELAADLAIMSCNVTCMGGGARAATHLLATAAPLDSLLATSTVSADADVNTATTSSILHFT
jgi:hypothetical protein